MGNLFGRVNTSCSCERILINRSRQNRASFQGHRRRALRVDQDVAVQDRRVHGEEIGIRRELVTH